MRTTRLVRALGVVVLVIAGLVAGGATAQAAEPRWSGLDARGYAGQIPAPGGLIATVPLDPALSVAGAGDAYRILYSTLDQHGRPAVSTAAVFVPKSAPPQGGWPVIAWAHGTVGLGDDCTPSARPRSARDNEYLPHWLEQGYAVVGSDYAGLGTPGLMSYLNSVTTARGVVDSVLAVHHMGLPLSPNWAVVGQSQGGGAAIATARWASEFSAGSSLDYRGVVATGTPATGRAAADQAETQCLAELSAGLADMKVSQFFHAPASSIPGFDEAVDQFMGVPTSGYDRPSFLGVGLLDRDVPPNLTLRFYDQLVADDQDVELKVYPDEDHGGTVLASLPDSTPFLARQFG